MSYEIHQELCSCCHRCRMECPAGAIRFKKSKYWIDPEKCLNCGKCKKVCHNGCITNTEDICEVLKHDKQTYTCDICIIGGGAAGMVAAAKAVDLRCQVIVVEKNHEIGGSAWYASSFITHYSKWHEQAGKKDNRDTIYQQFIQKLGGQVNEKLLKRLLDANAEWIDWMIEEHDLSKDFSFDEKGMMGHYLKQNTKCAWNDKRIDEMIGPGGAGWLICTRLESFLREKGVPILVNTCAKEFITDCDGKVLGVQCEDRGGIVEIICKSVIVASGAFSRSREIMQKMQPMFYDDFGKEPIHVFTCATCTGDGIKMCDKIGAEIDYKNRRVNMFGPKRHPYPEVTLSIGTGPMFYTDGHRYEESGGMKEISPLAYDANRYLWMITDDANAEANMQKRMDAKNSMTGLDVSHFIRNWRQVLQEEAEEGSVVIADSLEELAEKLGYDKEDFLQNIKDYNESLQFHKTAVFAMPGTKPKDGEIPDMSQVDILGMMAAMTGAKAKTIGKGPYYAVKQKLFHENAMGGIVIDEDTNVLKNGKKIPGIFAAGDTTRGIMVSGDIGAYYIEMVLSALTYAFNSGYIAGVEAAKYCEIL